MWRRRICPGISLGFEFSPGLADRVEDVQQVTSAAGYERTREAAMAAFAESWGRE
jgi:hypothetical protein